MLIALIASVLVLCTVYSLAIFVLSWIEQYKNGESPIEITQNLCAATLES